MRAKCIEKYPNFTVNKSYIVKIVETDLAGPYINHIKIVDDNGDLKTIKSRGARYSEGLATKMDPLEHFELIG